MVKVKNKASKSDKLRVKKVIKKVLNPFEVHVNKEKIKVLGRKTKNDKGLPGIARAKAMKKRKNTLGKEFELRHKSNKFVDRRIGERNSAMTAEDRITARFTAEQQRLHGNKHSIYNLEDTVLTHRGQTLSEIEKFEDPRSEDEFSDDESGQKRGGGRLEANFVADAHFGGGLFTKSGEEGTKSRKELIDQLIIESKKRKIEKQKQREATIEMTEKLDSEWKDLLPLVNTSKASAKDQDSTMKNDDYDIVMRQLKFEARGTPSDRLKSEDEIAKEEKTKLEKLENDRLSRMNCGSDEKTNKKKHRSADDLDDGLHLEAEPDFTLEYDQDGNLRNESHFLGDENQMSTNDENVEEDSGDDEESECDEQDDEEDDDDGDSLSDLKADETSSDEMSEDDMDTATNKNNLEKAVSPEKDAAKANELNDINVKSKTVEVNQNNMELDVASDSPQKLNNKNLNSESISNGQSKSDETLTQKIKADLLARKKVMEKAAKELPYTFKMPADYDELEKLLIKQSPDHQSIIIQRMIKCNHPSLSDGNKEKLGTLLAYLLQYINDIFSEINKNTIRNKFMVFDRLTPHIYDLCQMNPGNAYTCFMEVLKEKQNDYRKHKTSYPGLDTLIFFKLISVLFPTSDYRHQVVTPALAFISQMLSKCKVRTKSDIASGLFLVTLVLEYSVLSKRFLPAALNFIAGIIHMTIPKNSVQVLKIIPPFKPRNSLLVLEEPITEIPEKCELILSSLDFVEGPLEENHKLRIFYIALKLLDEFYSNLNVLDAAEMIFKPFMDLLSMVPVDKYPVEIKTQHEKTYALIQNCKNSMKEFLKFEKSRPKALRLYEPNIEKILYDTKRHRPMSKEKAEHEKLLHKYKREMKGALREIRRDKSYLAGLQIKKQIASDMERKAKVKQIYAEAAVQQGELNSLKRQK